MLDNIVIVLVCALSVAMVIFTIVFADDEILEQISSPTWKEDLINKAKELIGDSDKSWRVGKVGTN